MPPAISRLMRADKEGTLAALRTLRHEHRGRIVKTTGDGLLVEFVSVVDAARCAVEMHRGMAVRSAFATLTDPFTGEGAPTVSASQLCR